MAEGLPAARVPAAVVLVNLGLAGIVGAWASAWWLRGSGSPWGTRAGRQSGSALRLAAALTAAADALLLWMQAADMGEVPLTETLSTLPTMLTQTYAGRAWAGGALGLLVVLAATWSRSRARFAAVAMGASLFVYCRAAVSHAGEFGWLSLERAIEFTHLGADGLWLGGVGIAAWVLATPSGLRADDRADAAAWIESLSACATAALAVVVASGLFNAWRGLGSVSRLLGNDYGETLLVKLALVCVAVGLGGFNRFVAMPKWLAALSDSRGAPARWQSLFVRVLRIEAFFLFAALVAAAVLSGSPLPDTR